MSDRRGSRFDCEPDLEGRIKGDRKRSRTTTFFDDVDLVARSRIAESGGRVSFIRKGVIYACALGAVLFNGGCLSSGGGSGSSSNEIVVPEEFWRENLNENQVYDLFNNAYSGVGGYDRAFPGYLQVYVDGNTEDFVMTHNLIFPHDYPNPVIIFYERDEDFLQGRTPLYSQAQRAAESPFNAISIYVNRELRDNLESLLNGGRLSPENVLRLPGGRVYDSLEDLNNAELLPVQSVPEGVSHNYQFNRVSEREGIKYVRNEEERRKGGGNRDDEGPMICRR